MPLPTVAEVWSSYLFNQKQAPTGASLLNESLVRPETAVAIVNGQQVTSPVKGAAIEISAVDFMAAGAPGSLIKASDFNFIVF